MIEVIRDFQGTVLDIEKLKETVLRINNGIELSKEDMLLELQREREKYLLSTKDDEDEKEKIINAFDLAIDEILFEI